MRFPHQRLLTLILKMFCLLLLLSLRASAQDTGGMSGKVQMADGTSAGGVYIRFSGDYFDRTFTDKDGSFHRDLRQGSWEITAIKKGYIHSERPAQVIIVSNKT